MRPRARSSSWKSANWCTAPSWKTPRSSPPRRHTGQGIEELKAAIAEHVPARSRNAPTRQWFRLAIDRSFIVQGHGTVVTGSVTSGSVQGRRRGGMAAARRAGAGALAAKPRPARRGGAPRQRAAINLAGVRHEDVVRGQELATPGYLRPVAGGHGPAALPGRHAPADQAPGCRCASTSARPRSWARCRCSTATPSSPGSGAWPSCSSRNRPRHAGASRSSSANRRRRRPSAAARCCSRSRARSAAGTWRCSNASNGCGPANIRERVLTVAWFGGFAGFTIADLVRGADLGPDEAAGHGRRAAGGRRAGRSGHRPGAPAAPAHGHDPASWSNASWRCSIGCTSNSR